MSGVISPTVAIALQTLEATDASLQTAVMQAATGKSVATITDNPGAYVVASCLNSDAQALLAVNSGLAAAQVPTQVASAAVNGISAVLMKLQDTVIEGQSGGVSATAANTQIQSLLAQITDKQSDATVNGINLVGGAVGNGIATTQIRVPTDLNGGAITIGETGLSQMNASLPGLGLDSFSPTSDGTSLSFSSLAVENISTAPPPAQIRLETANYDGAETAQYPGQSWTFQFTDASSPGTETNDNTQTDPAGNITHQDHVIPVPLSAGFSLSDALTAVQQAMSAAGFDTQFATTSSGPTLSIAGNNVGQTNTEAPVQNLRPSDPIAVAVGSAQMLAAMPSGTNPISIKAQSLSLPFNEPLSALLGASYLSSQAEINAYLSSNPTTPAFYLSPPSGTELAPGTTIDSIVGPIITPPAPPPIPPALPVPPVPPKYNITLSTGVQANIPVTSSIGFLIPLPVIPTVTEGSWEGVQGVLATLNAASRKTSNMAQTLGNAVNTLQLAQTTASQSVDVLNTNIGTLTDADMGQVSARITALQIKQQLAAQSLALGEQWPSLLLQLFK
jgi:flagellin-like hook-associated protein FlgL